MGYSWIVESADGVEADQESSSLVQENLMKNDHPILKDGF